LAPVTTATRSFTQPPRRGSSAAFAALACPW